MGEHAHIDDGEVYVTTSSIAARADLVHVAPMRHDGSHVERRGASRWEVRRQCTRKDSDR
jgi:hypothetical protein